MPRILRVGEAAWIGQLTALDLPDCSALWCLFFHLGVSLRADVANIPQRDNRQKTRNKDWMVNTVTCLHEQRLGCYVGYYHRWLLFSLSQWDAHITYWFWLSLTVIAMVSNPCCLLWLPTASVCERAAENEKGERERVFVVFVVVVVKQHKSSNSSRINMRIFSSPSLHSTVPHLISSDWRSLSSSSSKFYTISVQEETVCVFMCICVCV